MDIDVALPADKVAEITDALFNKLNSILAKLKSVLLVENVLESLKVSKFIMYENLVPKNCKF